MIREVVKIDEDKCDGCGLCIPSCHEGALRLVNGKAKLVADAVCDGLGACLGHCPRGAITIERREATPFDEAAVVVAQRAARSGDGDGHACDAGSGGCPGARMIQFSREAETPPAAAAPPRSELTHWPVQIALLPPHAPVLRNARLLIAADCVPVAYADFHADLLRGRTVMIGCPKFDDLPAYVERLTAIMAQNELREVLVARMEVPCCTGLPRAVIEARRRAGVAVPLSEVIIGTRGDVLARNELPVAAASPCQTA
jgi:ferredoxin